MWLMQEKSIIVKDKHISGKKSQNSESEFRKMPLYVILICGLFIILIGIYLTISGNLTTGISQPGKYGEGGGNRLTVNGPYLLIFGFLFTIFPVYQLLRMFFKRRKHS